MSTLQQDNLLNIDYRTLISRNYAFIDESTQNKIKNCQLTFLGCGLASVIAEAAARIGFENFILVDHDTVELSNLNRQNYYLSDLNQLKVTSLQARLLAINPAITITCAAEKITSES